MTIAAASRALRTQFFALGALFATWGVQVPTVKLHYKLDERTLAMAMLTAGVGSLIALGQAGRLVGRYGPRAVSLVTGLLCCVALSLLIALPDMAALLLIMLAFGACASLFDVAINAQASEIEHRAGRSMMSGFHGMFSLGGMCGAGLGSLAPRIGLSAQQHLLVAALLGMPAIALAARSMLPRQAHTHCEQASPGLRRLLGSPLLLIGVLAALGLIAEGAMYDWSVLFMKQERASSIAQAALAFASFSAAMAVGRFAGDWVRSHLDPVAVMRSSAALATLGMALALLVPPAWAALLGFALVGLGLANVVPVLFSAASRIPEISPAHGIAAVSSLGYVGMMAGPPLIGLVAQASSLSWGISAVLLFACMMGLSARRALRA